jgi:hypothetical protein
MTDPVRPDEWLDTIANLKATPPLRRFRLLYALSLELEVAVVAVNLDIKEKERLLRETDGDIAFIKRHRGKLDVCYRAMRATYAAPDRAMASFNALCTDMSFEAVKEAISIGSHCLGKATGASILGVASQARKRADKNYMSVVIPALTKLIPEQQSYLEMLAGNIESDHATTREALVSSESERFALDEAQTQFEREILEAAMAMTPDDLDKLRPVPEVYSAAAALIEQNDAKGPSRED